MPNYQNGKIYCIRSHSRPDLVYVGSTCRRLSERFGKHKLVGNETSSRQIVELGDAYIELIENYACGSKEELNRREGQLIRSMDCVNKNIAGRTAAEYRQENKERTAKNNKKYRQENKEKISFNSKQKIDCECGATMRRNDFARHKRTNKHIHWQQIYDFIYS